MLLIIFTREFKLQKQKKNHIVVARITLLMVVITFNICVYKKMKIVKMKIYNCRCNDFILYLVADLQCYSIWCNSCPEVYQFKWLYFKMPNRILVSIKGSNNTWNLLSHFKFPFQKKLFGDVFIFRTQSNKNMRLWEQNKYGSIPNPKTDKKSSWMKCYPNSKRHELLKMLVNLQWRIQGGGGLGAYACPFFVVSSFYNSEVYEQKISIERVRN